MSEHPEHDRLASVADQTQAAGEFLEWLAGEHGFFLAKRVEGSAYPREVYQSLEKLLAEWQGIDLCVLEREKRRMLEEMRAHG